MEFPRGIGFLLLAATVLIPQQAILASDHHESGLKIKGQEFALNIPLDASRNTEDIFVETGDSDPPEKPYQTLMINGTLPNNETELFVRFPDLETGIPEWLQIDLKKYTNGRFWTIINLEKPTTSRVNLRFSVKGRIYQDLTLYGVTLSEKLSPEKGANKKITGDSSATNEPKGLTIYTRPDWHARAPQGNYAAQRPKKITLHHTAGKRPAHLFESIDELQFLQDFHQKSRGWLDIGYHFIIDGEGRIFEGRPAGSKGAHVSGGNTGNIGVAVMGYYHEPINDDPSTQQLESVSKLIAWLSGAYSIAPETLKGHRDLNPTACPGDELYKVLDPIKIRAAELLPGAGTARAKKSTPLRMPRFNFDSSIN